MSNSLRPNPVDRSPPGSSVHGILQARILEWVAMPSSRGSSWPRDRTWGPCLVSPHLSGRLFTTSASWKAQWTLVTTCFPLWMKQWDSNDLSWDDTSLGMSLQKSSVEPCAEKSELHWLLPRGWRWVPGALSHSHPQSHCSRVLGCLSFSKSLLVLVLVGVQQSSLSLKASL